MPIAEGPQEVFLPWTIKFLRTALHEKVIADNISNNLLRTRYLMAK